MVQQQDTATLISLAFSDYQLWEFPSLRDPNRDGFIPIRTLFQRSPVFRDYDDISEVSVVKCINKDVFDIRMIIVDKSRQNLVGGYEIRRKDWAEVTERFPSFSPEYWDARTVYIENIPHPFRSIVGICNLLRAILNSSPVQHIIFPPHHQDPPDAIPKCKGFALVTLNEPDDVSHLLSRFPYDRDHTPAPTDDISSVDESEARKAGFRALSKERWDGLQAEYVEYRESLLRDMAVDASTVPNYTPNKIESPHGPPDEPQRASGPGVVPAVNLPSYPSGCVLFARHVPPNTNKTALRTLFSALLAYASALDYVDYTKGLDSCYLRLTTPEHGQALLAAARSKQGDASVQNLELELLEGRREEVYWENVPEKVRALAAQRARAQVQKNRPDAGQDGNGDDEGGAGHGSGTRRCKRRR